MSVGGIGPSDNFFRMRTEGTQSFNYGGNNDFKPESNDHQPTSIFSQGNGSYTPQNFSYSQPDPYQTKPKGIDFSA